MLIGLVGKPNAGKSTLFNALTHGHAQVAPYPFTTIKPNQGVAFATTECACKKLNLTCSPRVGSCVDGVRRIPVNVVDVAGLVPGAHEGKGMGNQFLNDLVAADALVLVVDASGSTDEQGNPAQGYAPAQDALFLESELVHWIAGIIGKNVQKCKGKPFSELAQGLSGIKVSEEDVNASIHALHLPENFSQWSKQQILLLAGELLKRSKPTAVAANKMDLPQARQNLAKLAETLSGKIIVPVCADYELALNYAAEKQLVEYDGKKIVKKNGLDEKASKAVDKIGLFVNEFNGTGVQELVNKVVFDLLNCIVVFPVEDETHYSDHFGKILPDAVLLPAGSTPVALAAKIHSDLAKGFLYSIDAKKKMRIGSETKLKDGDVVKIVSAK